MRETRTGRRCAGWPGVFRRLRHDVPIRPRRVVVRGVEVTFSACGSACLPPTGAGGERPWCPRCRPPEPEKQETT